MSFLLKTKVSPENKFGFLSKRPTVAALTEMLANIKRLREKMFWLIVPCLTAQKCSILLITAFCETKVPKMVSNEKSKRYSSLILKIANN